MGAAHWGQDGCVGGEGRGGGIVSWVQEGGSRGEMCIMGPMTQFASLNNLHPEGL